jgi:nitrogenase molybdenum-iron protein alpha chain
MALIDTKFPLTREKRSNALSHYQGTLVSLKEYVSEDDARQRVRTFTQTTADEISGTLSVVSGIDDVSVIVHGATGCAASALNSGGYHRVYSTNLSERDTIIGGDERLRVAIARAAKDGAKAVFVLGTPVTAINNDDVSATILEAESEYGIKIVFLNTDGFKSKTVYTGYDIAFHGILQDFVGNEGGIEGDFVNILTVDEKIGDVVSVLAVLRALGIRYNILPAFSNLKNLEKAGVAKATVAINQSKTEYLALGLEESFGVTYMRTPAPIGVAATEYFVSELGKTFDVQDKANEIISDKRRELANVLSSKPLGGKKTFLQTDISELQGIVDLIHGFGGEIVGFSISEVDDCNKDALMNMKGVDDGASAIVADGQVFEIANILSKLRPDIYIAKDGPVSFSSAFGAIPVSLETSTYYGYDGIRSFHRLIRERDERPQSEKIYSARKPYRDSWLKKSADWYVKREVK